MHCHILRKNPSIQLREYPLVLLSFACLQFPKKSLRLSNINFLWQIPLGAILLQTLVRILYVPLFSPIIFSAQRLSLLRWTDLRENFKEVLTDLFCVISVCLADEPDCIRQKDVAFAFSALYFCHSSYSLFVICFMAVTSIYWDLLIQIFDVKVLVQSGICFIFPY